MTTDTEAKAPDGWEIAFSDLVHNPDAEMLLEHLHRSFLCYSEQLARAVLEMATGQCDLGLRRVNLVREMVYGRANVLGAMLAEEHETTPKAPTPDARH